MVEDLNHAFATLEAEVKRLGSDMTITARHTEISITDTVNGALDDNEKKNQQNSEEIIHMIEELRKSVCKALQEVKNTTDIKKEPGEIEGALQGAGGEKKNDTEIGIKQEPEGSGPEIKKEPEENSTGAAGGMDENDAELKKFQKAWDNGEIA